MPPTYDTTVSTSDASSLTVQHRGAQLVTVTVAVQQKNTTRHRCKEHSKCLIASAPQLLCSVIRHMRPICTVRHSDFNTDIPLRSGQCLSSIPAILAPSHPITLAIPPPAVIDPGIRRALGQYEPEWTSLTLEGGHSMTDSCSIESGLQRGHSLYLSPL